MVSLDFRDIVNSLFMIVLNFAIPLFGIKSGEYKIASTYVLLLFHIAQICLKN